MDGRKRFKYAMCGRVVFKKRKKNTVSVFKNILIRVDRAL